MKKITNKLVLIVRHAERADLLENANLNNLKCGKYDSELTLSGKEESFMLGEGISNFLINECKLNNWSEDCSLSNFRFKLICSPFVRTISTASNLLRGMDLNKNVPIVIENGLCEKMNVKWYPEPPENFLVLYQKDHSHPSKKYLSKELLNCEIKLNKSLFPLPKHPELPDEFVGRINNTFNTVMSHYMQRYNVLIMVTHYLAVQKFAQAYIDKDFQLPVEYCITLAFRYNQHAPEKEKLEYVDKIYPF